MNIRYQEFGDWDKKICQLFEETAETFKGKNSQIKKSQLFQIISVKFHSSAYVILTSADTCKPATNFL